MEYVNNHFIIASRAYSLHFYTSIHPKASSSASKINVKFFLTKNQCEVRLAATASAMQGTTLIL
jgi:hypothetical protein